jgi:hypothetical protein
VKKLSKYRAVPTVVDGVRFASKKEARRYSELKLLEKAGEISELRLQPRYHLTVKGVKLGEYRGDFSYVERADLFQHGDRRGGFFVIEDTKGFRTELYRWKRKHMLAEYGIEIREV